MLIQGALNVVVDCGGLGSGQRGLRLDKRNLIVDAGIVAALLSIKGFLIGVHQVVEDFLQCVLAANLEEILGQARLLCQLLIGQIGRGDLGVVLRGMDRVANLSPKIGLPRNFGGE